MTKIHQPTDQDRAVHIPYTAKTRRALYRLPRIAVSSKEQVGRLNPLGAP